MNKLRCLISRLSIGLGLSVALLLVVLASDSARNSSQGFNRPNTETSSSLLSRLVSFSPPMTDRLKSDVRVSTERKNLMRRARPEACSIALLGLGLLMYLIRRRKPLGMAWDLR